MKRYQHPTDAVDAPQDELNALFPTDSRECPDPKGWISELPRTSDAPTRPCPPRHRRNK